MGCRRRICRAFAAIAVAIAACSVQPERNAAAAVIPSNAALGVWEYPASEFPSMCIAFLPDGELRFQGGFLFFNPGRWERNSKDGTVRITLGGAVPFPFNVPRRHREHPVGTMVAAIPNQRILVYHLSADSASLEFAGFIFYRKATCAVE